MRKSREIIEEMERLTGRKKEIKSVQDIIDLFDSAIDVIERQKKEIKALQDTISRLSGGTTHAKGDAPD